jgi:hypothetical protein
MNVEGIGTSMARGIASSILSILHPASRYRMMLDVGCWQDDGCWILDFGISCVLETVGDGFTTTPAYKQ